MTGIVENIQRGHCFIRSDEDWTRYFAAGVDCDGEIPEQFARVATSFRKTEGNSDALMV